ncbi:peptidase C45 [Sporocytophaga myxococcoides]|uniref:Peptidase C45 n=1 Tax=Sporocytophaga myxococcoides TaxID=153721 RepID=A0A098L8D1_9BACT|nr:C45 family peptidase [Sporocytophaga myxococcoides]GAL82960.1 peptidase C45 [Sporocytophaga myxococcoides]
MGIKKRHVFTGIIAIFLFLIIWFISVALAFPPVPPNTDVHSLQREEVSKGFYRIGNNWFKKNEFGMYEMYVEGSPYERGVINGKLSTELVKRQEDVFVGQITELVPNKTYRGFLKYLIGWFNRNLDENIPLEYKQEISGVSLSASENYYAIGTPYQRLLNYHAAHDIGHALQDKNLVGCTSFAAWDAKSQDGGLIVGRNFDFYVGDEFAQDKIIAFIAPDSGNKFMMVTWGGMTGVLSGMNEQGLTVTINAAKSDPPLGSAMPISLLAREILQYASTIDEAYKIALQRKTFVSESILIGSSNENKAAIIEKSPNKQGLLRSDQNYIVCSNHYQSEVFANDPLNIQNIKESSSLYRYHRMDQLIGKYPKIGVKETAKILRDKNGLDDKVLGYGNEKAMNQLIAHHSVIFKPALRQVWVSSNPYVLGAYVAYDLNKIFQLKGLNRDTAIYEKSLVIPADSFMLTPEFRNYESYKRLKKFLKKQMSLKSTVALDSIVKIVRCNPDSYESHWIAGDCYRYLGKKDEASFMYKEALKKEIPTLFEKNKIEKLLGTLYEN